MDSELEEQLRYWLVLPDGDLRGLEIQLYIPPSIVTQGEANRYSAVYNRFTESLNSLKLDEADVALKQMDSIGAFCPWFIPHPEEPPTPIYPTIPEDLSHLIRIGDAVANCLLGKTRLDA